VQKDIWQQLYEFPLIETSKEMPVKKILLQAEKLKWLTKDEYEIIFVSCLYKQQLSHQLITGQFIKIQLKQKPDLKNNLLWMTKDKLGEYAFPQFINQYLKPGNTRQNLF
jgi:A/G-specific adenine glycosylase